MAIWVLTDRRYLAQRMPRALLDLLEEEGVPARIVLADEVVGRVDCAVPWPGVRSGDVVVARTRHLAGLQLLALAELAGVASLISAQAMGLLRDKAGGLARFGRQGVPVAPTYLAPAPHALTSLPPDAFPLVLKPPFGDNAGGIHIVRSPAELGSVAWGDEPVVAQPYLDAGAMDTKLYVVGSRTWVVRRVSPLVGAGLLDAPIGQAEEVARPAGERWQNIAATCRRVAGVPLLGIDLLETADGPRVVDVNEFPNYTGVAEAPQAIAQLLLNVAGARR